jgi:phosphatidyl-myo-inositol dimannoside synthase
VLFITRKYPPSVGGMEMLSFQLHSEMARLTATEVIAWRGSQKFLPGFVVWAFIRTLWLSVRKPLRLIHVSDPVLAPLGLVLKWLLHIPVFTTAHGLDITFDNPFYQVVMRFCLERLDGVVCISMFTLSECLKRGVSRARCRVIYPGVDVTAQERSQYAYRLLEDFAKREIQGRKVVLSVGRLVERKGFVWFVREVLPDLVTMCPTILYLVCGDGPLYEKLMTEIQRRNLSEHVCLLGKVDRRILQVAYSCADVFVMPNIVVPGQPEGFGLVTLEARACGTPVVAANLEGIGESILHGKDGLLVNSGDARCFLESVLKIVNNEAGLWSREQIQNHASMTASWSSMAVRYLEAFQAWIELR